MRGLGACEYVLGAVGAVAIGKSTVFSGKTGGFRGKTGAEVRGRDGCRMEGERRLGPGRGDASVAHRSKNDRKQK